MNYYFANNYIDYNIKPTYLQKLPIHLVDFDNLSERENYNKIAKLVDRMLDLNKSLQEAIPPNDKEALFLAPCYNWTNREERFNKGVSGNDTQEMDGGGETISCAGDVQKRPTGNAALQIVRHQRCPGVQMAG
jgi:hypothetical protein